MADRRTLQKYCDELGLDFSMRETNLEIEARIRKVGSMYSEEGMSDGLVGFLKREE